VSEAAGRGLTGGRACGKGGRAYHGCTSFSAIEQRDGTRSLVASGRGDGDGGGVESGVREVERVRAQS
jgi:hypothetical protein